MKPEREGAAVTSSSIHATTSHVRDPLLADLGGDNRAKPVPPKPDRLMADVDPTIGQEILDVA
jgi:hypothetical protein